MQFTPAHGLHQNDKKHPGERYQQVIVDEGWKGFNKRARQTYYHRECNRPKRAGDLQSVKPRKKDQKYDHTAGKKDYGPQPRLTLIPWKAPSSKAPAQHVGQRITNGKNAPNGGGVFNLIPEHQQQQKYRHSVVKLSGESRLSGARGSKQRRDEESVKDCHYCES